MPQKLDHEHDEGVLRLVEVGLEISGVLEVDAATLGVPPSIHAECLGAVECLVAGLGDLAGAPRRESHVVELAGVEAQFSVGEGADCTDD